MVFTPPGYATAGLLVTGLDRKQVQFAPGFYQQCADALRSMLIKELSSQGIAVLDTSAVRASGAYAKFTTAGDDTTPLLQQLNLFSSDTGRIQEMVSYPASGLRIITGVQKSSDNLEQVEMELIKQLGADASMRARIRVGLYRGHASLEKDSTIWLTDKNKAGNLIALHTILSESQVIDYDQFKLVSGRIYHVRSEQYMAAMRELYPLYLKMAFGSP